MFLATPVITRHLKFYLLEMMGSDEILKCLRLELIGCSVTGRAVVLLSCQPRVMVTSCLVYKIIRT